MPTESTVASTDDVELAVYDYEPTSALPTVLLSHATGFHGRVFDPVAHELAATNHCITFDYRGYGNSTLPHDWQVRWQGYCDDALAVARVAAANGPIVAAGHSMGAAALVMAAIREPQLFRALVLFEPIIFPDVARTNGGGPSPLVVGARRRRTTFASFDDAYANFSSKPPLNVFSPESLRTYVDFGFAQQPDGSVVLKCLPEHEARTYETGAMHETWGDLNKLRVPSWLVSGAYIDSSPSSFTEMIANCIDGSTYVQWNDLGHFGPMQNPQRFAKLISLVGANVP
jgi:pimeloyl-ACP methyl ester carboxylesterase